MTPTAEYPEWYLDESLMWAFIRQGGTSPERQTKMRKDVEDCLVTHPLRESEEIGYVDVEAPLGAERMRWMFRTPELQYLPLLLPESGPDRFVNERMDVMPVDAGTLTSEQFLRIALNYPIIVHS